MRNSRWVRIASKRVLSDCGSCISQAKALAAHCGNANGGVLFHQISKGGHPKRDRSNRKGTSTLRHYGNEIRRTPANVGVVVRHSKTWWSTAAMGQRRSSGDVRDRSAHTPIATQKRTFAHFANVPLAEVSTACFAASLPSCPGGGCASRGCCSAGKAS
jgi:hypothetical protein